MRYTLTVLLAVLCFGCATKSGPGVARPTLPEPVNLVPEPLRLSGSEQYAGQNALVEKVGTGNLDGKLVILDAPVDGAHAEAVKRVVLNAGVPEEYVSVQGETNIQHAGKLTVPSDTRVIVRSPACLREQ